MVLRHQDPRNAVEKSRRKPLAPAMQRENGSFHPYPLSITFAHRKRCVYITVVLSHTLYEYYDSYQETCEEKDGAKASGSMKR